MCRCFRSGIFIACADGALAVNCLCIQAPWLRAAGATKPKAGPGAGAVLWMHAQVSARPMHVRVRGHFPEEEPSLGFTLLRLTAPTLPRSDAQGILKT